MATVQARLEKIETVQREVLINKIRAIFDQLSDEHYMQLKTACDAFVGNPDYQITGEQAEAYEAFGKLGGWDMVETLVSIKAGTQ